MNEQDKALDLFQRWKQNPAPETLSPLMASLEPTINKTLKSYGYSGNPNFELKMQLHLADSLKRYDPEKSNIKTFAANELKRAHREFPRYSHTIPKPEQVAIDLKNVEQQKDDLVASFGRDPTIKELADSTGLSEHRISYLEKKYSSPMVIQEQAAAQNTAPAVEPLNFEHLWIESIYTGLDPINQKIVDWSLGWHNQPILSKSEMSKRLSISKPAITQRTQKLAAKFNEGLDYKI